MSSKVPELRRGSSRRIRVASDRLHETVKESCKELTRFLLAEAKKTKENPEGLVPHPAIAAFVIVAAEFRDVIQAALYPPITGQGK